MILPLFGFITACIVFGLAGCAFLLVHPGLKLTVKNIVWFTMGALPGSLIIGALYGWTFADGDGRLTSSISVMGMFATILMGGIVAGWCAVLLQKSFLGATSSGKDDTISKMK